MNIIPLNLLIHISIIFDIAGISLSMAECYKDKLETFSGLAKPRLWLDSLGHCCLCLLGFDLQERDAAPVAYLSIIPYLNLIVIEVLNKLFFAFYHILYTFLMSNPSTILFLRNVEIGKL